MNRVNIGSDNGLLIRRQAIILTSAGILSIGTYKKFQWNFNQNKKLFIHENASENIVDEMVAMLCRGRWVDIIAIMINGIVRHQTPPTIITSPLRYWLQYYATSTVHHFLYTE